MIFIFMSFSLVIFVLLFLRKKLLSLLMLEGCMLTLIISLSMISHLEFGSGSSVCVSLMVFLVADSVFALSLLGNSTRFSFSTSPFLFSF